MAQSFESEPTSPCLDLAPLRVVLIGSNVADLAEKLERLTAVRAALAEREADIAQVRSQLNAFEGRCFT